MEGVAVDPNDPNHVLVVKTSYAASSHVYRTNNALAVMQHLLVFKMMIRRCHICLSMMLQLISMMQIVTS